MKLGVLLAQFLDGNGSYPTATSDVFFWQVYVPILTWLILVLILFVILLRKYTFGHWTKENPNPGEGETLELPRGTFRGILTLTLLFVTVILETVSVHTPGFEDNVHEFLVGFQMMIAFYFGSKVMHHITSTDRQKTEIISESTRQEMTASLPSEGQNDDMSGQGDVPPHDEEALG